MPDEDKNIGESLVLDFRKWWYHVKTIYKLSRRIQKALPTHENKTLNPEKLLHS